MDYIAVHLRFFCKGSIRASVVAHISNQTIPVLLEMLAHLVLCLDEFYLVTELDWFL